MSYQYPLQMNFKLIALAPRIYIKDASGQEILFVHQKTLALKEHIRIFTDSSKRQEVFTIRADRVIDFSAQYHFTETASGRSIGSIKHKGLRSIWNATYLVFDANGQQVAHVTEDNPWVKVVDMFLQDVPVLGWFTGYIFHPSYTAVSDRTGQPVFKLKKEPAFFESAFTIEKLDESVSGEEETRLLLALMLMVQLERSRG